jgi:hypothetical protein
VIPFFYENDYGNDYENDHVNDHDHFLHVNEHVPIYYYKWKYEGLTQNMIMPIKFTAIPKPPTIKIMRGFSMGSISMYLSKASLKMKIQTATKNTPLINPPIISALPQP